MTPEPESPPCGCHGEHPYSLGGAAPCGPLCGLHAAAPETARRLAEVSRERDAALEDIEMWSGRAVQAEAEVVRIRGALRGLIEWSNGRRLGDAPWRTARDALDPPEGAR